MNKGAYVTILFFARIKDEIGQGSYTFALNREQTIMDVRNSLLALSDDFSVLNSKSILCACNQSSAKLNHPIEAGDEIAFFPPVTGG